MDEMVKETQVWLNKTYGKVSGFGKVPEDGNTGWNTVYGLTRALQHELGITDLVDNFGPLKHQLLILAQLGQSLKLFNMVFTLMVSIQAPSMANLHKMLPTV
ncbi:hypothetical protein KGF72_000190 (plasmid) [Lactiplantibacillus pentosus]